MLFSKKTDITSLKKAHDNAAIILWGKDKTKWPKKLHNPFKDGDEIYEENNERKECKGMIVVSASSKKRPVLVNSDVQPIALDEITEVFYAGSMCVARLTAFAYEHEKGKKGVGFTMTHLQKVGDGERLGGGVLAADSVFAAAESEDESNYESEEGTDYSSDSDEDTEQDWA